MSSILLQETRSFAGLNLAGKKCLLVASTGGHLSQLSRIAATLDLHEDSEIATFDSPQSRSLDLPFTVRAIPYIAPRGLNRAVGSARLFADILKGNRFDAVVSTGAAIAVPALVVATAFRVRPIYIESYSRFTAPSLTGTILSKMPLIELYTQHPSWSSKRWQYTGSIMDTVRNSPRASDIATRNGPLKIFVTLGTIRPYRFDALVDKVVSVAPAGSQIIWQVGVTSRDDLPGEVFEEIERRDFREIASRSDVIISHGGTGTAIDLVEMGKRPIIVPRRAQRNEHIDDHQLQVAQDLSDRDMVLLREIDDLDSRAIVEACS